MLTLRSRATHFVVGPNSSPPRIFRLTDDKDRPGPLRKAEGFISRDGEIPEGFAWYVLPHGTDAPSEYDIPDSAAAVFVPQALNYIAAGDILRVGSTRGDIAVLFQKSARHHSFLLTERCNHYCLMCSQPPRDVDDGWIYDDLMLAIPLIDRTTHEIGFTGGEPTLLGSKLVSLIRQCKSFLPETGLHVLTNGRAFKELRFVEEIAQISHHDLMFGIPIYSDLSHRHDYVVQSDGAFDETIRGILNLKRHGLRVEIRVVVHKQTFERLPQLSRFIARNLTFVDQVVFMGLEMTGFTLANVDTLWIDPVEYQAQLKEAVDLLVGSRIRTSIYNHQLCITDRTLWPFARRSISDWKNEYMSECEGCTMRAECGGFFSSAKLRYSSHIRPFA